jgi:glycosyltransferase involved in cell wall biosynthesis
MKVAIISSGFLPVVDGVTVTLLNRLYRLSQWGHQVLLFCPSYACLEKIYPNWQDYTGEFLPGVKAIALPSDSIMGLDFERNVTRQSYQIVLQELKQFKPDIIHVDEPERLFFGFLKVAGIDFAKQNKIPCTSFFHTNFLEYGRDYFNSPVWLDRILKWLFKFPLVWLYNQYDATLVSSQISYQKLANIGFENLIYSELLGVKIQKSNRSLRNEDFFEKNYKIPNLSGCLKIIFVGRLTPDKGWNFTIKALTKMVQKYDLKCLNIALIVAGDGAMRKTITTQLDKIIPNLYFLGRVAPDAVPELLANCDIHVTTSEKETKGLTILEAFAAGIPAIAPRAGGVIDSIEEGWNGFLYEPQNVDDFIKKLNLLIEDSHLRQAMGNRGKEYVARFSWDNAVSNLLEIWEKQIANYPSRSRSANLSNVK